jgi:glutamate 5-kinase
MAITSLDEILSARRIVLKIGSALLIEGGGARREWLAGLADDIAELRGAGAEVIVVSSGAIALGAAKLDLPDGGRGSLADAQAAASVGQVALARLWSAALEERGAVAAQMLLTLDDLEDRRRYLNASVTFNRLIEAGAVPIVNENDSVATEEIRFGDNDRLAARVAQAAKADAVLLLSDVDGLYDRPPARAGAKLIAEVSEVDAELRSMADRGSGSGLGSGGMEAKLEAAQIAQGAGIALGIINGTAQRPITRMKSSGIGTLFLAHSGSDARKAWLSGRIAPAGTLVVDAGCEKALSEQGASVLAVGITEVEGSFQRGDLVLIQGPSGNRLAQGLSEYDAVSCRRIAGLREDQQAKVLGHAPRAAAVHRDHMVLL